MSDGESTVFVPGRIELFGKHVDYGGGPSLTCAVGAGITAVFEPIERIDAADGPIKVMPASSQACAKSAFSLKNP